MQLSPFAQYYIRKLLRQNVDDLNHFLINDLNNSLLMGLDLNQVLNNLYPKQSDLTAKKWELETLTQIYQEFEKGSDDRENLIEIKRRILDILGFKRSPATASKLPTIMQEKRLQPFCFYREGEILESVNHNHDFYGLVKQFETAQRLQAYQLAWALSVKNVPLILTTSPLRLGIWIRLRSPVYSVWLNQGDILWLYSVSIF